MKWIYLKDDFRYMDSIKDALTQAGNLVQQAAHTVVEALRGGENEEKVSWCD